MKTNIYFLSYLASFFPDKSCIATLNIHLIFNNVFFENRAVHDNAAKYFRGKGGGGGHKKKYGASLLHAQ